jgi:chromate reductase
MRLLTIAGSLREGSYNGALLLAAEELAGDGVEVERYDGLHAIPPFAGDREAEQAPPEVDHLRRVIERADALLVATPEYNGSIPGVLKNALDWVSTPFPENALRGKPVAIVGASTGGYGAMWAQADLKRVLGLIGARVVGAGLPVERAHQKFDQSGRLVDPHVRERLARAVAALVAEVEPAGIAA